MRLLLPLFLAVLTPAALALGDVQEPVTHQGFSAVSSDKACHVAAQRLKSNVNAMGWTILSKGNVPCDCKAVLGGWQCSITALVRKPSDDDSSEYRN
jgi:hypothetical protein